MLVSIFYFLWHILNLIGIARLSNCLSNVGRTGINFIFGYTAVLQIIFKHNSAEQGFAVYKIVISELAQRFSLMGHGRIVSNDNVCKLLRFDSLFTYIPSINVSINQNIVKDVVNELPHISGFGTETTRELLRNFCCKKSNLFGCILNVLLFITA